MMIGKVLLSASIFGTFVSCLSVTSPASGSVLDTSRATTVVWSSNDTDPAYFDLYLINDDRIPSVSIEIASNITTATGSYTFDGVDVVPSSGYRFTLKDTSNDNLITQSDTFIVVAKGDDTTTVTSRTSTSTSTSISTTSTTASSGSTSTTTSTGTTYTTATTTSPASSSTTSSSRTDSTSSSSSSRAASSSASHTPSSSSTSSSMGTVLHGPSSASITGLMALVIALML